MSFVFCFRSLVTFICQFVFCLTGKFICYQKHFLQSVSKGFLQKLLKVVLNSARLQIYFFSTMKSLKALVRNSQIFHCKHIFPKKVYLFWVTRQVWEHQSVSLQGSTVSEDPRKSSPPEPSHRRKEDLIHRHFQLENQVCSSGCQFQHHWCRGRTGEGKANILDEDHDEDRWAW